VSEGEDFEGGIVPTAKENRDAGMQNLYPERIVAIWFRSGVPTTSAFVGQRLFLGNAISGVYKGPASVMFHASLARSFAITKRFKISCRLEAFNALNHTVLNGPGGSVGPDMSSFGIVTSAMDPRRLQMSARFIF
jgi:hypothetical protein